MFENIFDIQMGADYVNRKLVAIRSTEIGLDAPTNSGGSWKVVTAGINANQTATMTGRSVELSGGKIAVQIRYSTDGYGYILQENMNDWKFSNLINAGATKSVQAELNELIQNHQIILENNLLCARIIKVAETNNITVPTHLRKKLYDLQIRLQDRNNELKKHPDITEYQEATSPNFSRYNSILQDFMNNPKIGVVISTTVAIVIAVTIFVLSGSTAYLIIRTLTAKSKEDIKYSDKLLNDLKQYLPEPVFNQLIKENEKNADQFARSANRGSISSTIRTVGYGLAGILGFMFLTNLLNKTN